MAKTVYLQVQEGDADQIVWRGSNQLDPLKAGFAVDVQSRLEATAADKCIMYLFADRKTAIAHREYVKKLLHKRAGAGFLRSSVGIPAESGKTWIMFARGEKWHILPPDWLHKPLPVKGTRTNAK